MPALEPIEAALARLMPPAFSDDGQRGIEAMLDELAGDRNDAKPSRSGIRRPGPWLIGTGIAAAIGVLWAVMPSARNDSHPVAVAIRSNASSSGLVLVSESSRVESMTDEGWREDADGAAMQALRLNVVDENSVRDEETGMIVRISEPREEILLTPVSAF